MYLVFTRMPDESYRRRLRTLLLYLSYVFRALINSLVCCVFTRASVSDLFIYHCFGSLLVYLYVKSVNVLFYVCSQQGGFRRRRNQLSILIIIIIKHNY